MAKKVKKVGGFPKMKNDLTPPKPVAAPARAMKRTAKKGKGKY